MTTRDRVAYNAYQRVYQLNRYHSRRDAALWLLGDVCSSCGTDNDLNFDHRQPEEKSFPVSKLWSINEQDFVCEILKCHILCGNCHREKTRRNGDIGRGKKEAARRRNSIGRVPSF